MTRSNGGFIGSPAAISEAGGPGLYSVSDAQELAGAGAWPIYRYTVSRSAASVNEGGTVTFTISSTAPDNYALAYTVVGISSADLSSGSLSGTVTLLSGTATVSFTLSADATTEGAETLTFQLRLGSTTGEVLATNTCTISDTSLDPTYAVSPNTTSITEGNTVTWTITTTNVPNGTTLYWTNSGTTTSADISGGAVSGSFTINSNTGTVSLTVLSADAYEGTETIILQIRTASISGTVVATSTTVNITDAAPTYSVSPSTTSVNEGSSVTWTVTTTNVANGTTLYWTNSGTAVAGDFTQGVNSGSFTINSSTGSFSLTMASDTNTEGTETIIAQIRTGSTSGTIVATSATVSINDTSTSVPPTAVDFLVVGGGGGGGCLGGGGGGGGWLCGSVTVASGNTYNVVVGAGGAGASAAPGYGCNGGGSAWNSTCLGGVSLCCFVTGGGGGGRWGTLAGGNTSTYGSGGGGGTCTPTSATTRGCGGSGNTAGATPVRGYQGGYGETSYTLYGESLPYTCFQGGGGGGAGGVGRNGLGPGYGTGGPTCTWHINCPLPGGYSRGGPGTDYYNSDGWGPEGWCTTLANTGDGGGGGGGNYSPAVGSYGTAGGSGVVFVRYPDCFCNAAAVTGAPEFTTANGFKVYRFVGNGTIRW